MELLGEIELGQRVDRARKLLDQVGFWINRTSSRVSSRRPTTESSDCSSSGQRPTLIVADEPTGNLDSNHRRAGDATLEDAGGSGHDPGAGQPRPGGAQMADRVVSLDDGVLEHSSIDGPIVGDVRPVGAPA